MIVAAAYENGDIFPHFGRTEYFKIYRIEDGKVVSSEVLSTEGAGHSLIVGWLMEHKVDAVICGGVGGGEVGFLTKAGIRIIAGVSGSADKAVEALLKGELEGVSDPTCQHEDGHGEGCQCHGGAATAIAGITNNPPARGRGAPTLYPSATSRTIMIMNPTAKPMVAMLECSPTWASGISSSTTT